VFLRHFLSEMLFFIVAIVAAILTYAWNSTPRDSEHIEGPANMPTYDRNFYPNSSFADSVLGKTRYSLLGPSDGERVVVVHGFMSPSIIWADVAGALAKAGYLVLVYDLLGRGYSDAPATTYNEATHVLQLHLLLRHLQWEKCNVFGLSMGGGISVAYTRWFPESVNKLALLAPAGLMEIKELGTLGRLLRVPIVGECLTGLVWRLLQVFSVERYTVGDQTDPESILKRAVIQQFRSHRGSLRAILSSARFFPLTQLQEHYDIVGRSHHALVIWGSEDVTVPYPQCADRLRWHMPQATIEVIAGAGHEAVATHAEIVGARLIRFLQE